jgi:hypothetical protein
VLEQDSAELREKYDAPGRRSCLQLYELATAVQLVPDVDVVAPPTEPRNGATDSPSRTALQACLTIRRAGHRADMNTRRPHPAIVRLFDRGQLKELRALFHQRLRRRLNNETTLRQDVRN